MGRRPAAIARIGRPNARFDAVFDEVDHRKTQKWLEM
jgi:hypothetical protein